MKQTGHPPPGMPIKYKLDIIGCPNYLLQSAPAPKCYLENNDRPINYRADVAEPVTWRLLWKDDRYVDGTIPEEEKLYFAEPGPEEAARERAGTRRNAPTGSAE